MAVMAGERFWPRTRAATVELKEIPTRRIAGSGESGEFEF